MRIVYKIWFSMSILYFWENEFHCASAHSAFGRRYTNIYINQMIKQKVTIIYRCILGNSFCSSANSIRINFDFQRFNLAWHSIQFYWIIQSDSLYYPKEKKIRIKEIKANGSSDFDEFEIESKKKVEENVLGRVLCVRGMWRQLAIHQL